MAETTKKNRTSKPESRLGVRNDSVKVYLERKFPTSNRKYTEVLSLNDLVMILQKADSSITRLAITPVYQAPIEELIGLGLAASQNVEGDEE